jgi:tetratricopeptide (TPR) repeat protein
MGGFSAMTSHMNSDRPTTSIADADADAAVAEGAAHHRAGRLAEAEAVYAAVLAWAPGHPKALHNLGAVYLQRKELDRALPLLAAAASADPEGPQTWITYGHALVMAGRFEAAERLIGERRASSDGAAALEMRLRQAWAMALSAAGDFAKAEAQLLRAVQIAPEDPDTNADLGLAQLHQGRVEAAKASLARALAAAPDHIEALVNMGSALKALGGSDEALAHYRAALALAPAHGPALRNLGVLLGDLGRHGPALDLADQVLAGRAAHPQALMLRAAALHGLGRYDEALAAYSEAASHGSDPDEALVKAGFTRLLLGDFQRGWRDYEARWRTDLLMAGSMGAVSPELRARLDLTATGYASESVLLLSEQGVGDAIMFASALPDLAASAAQVTCACERRLIRLFANSFPTVSFVDPREARLASSAFTKVVAMGSLGRVYRNRLEDFPGTPYLRPCAGVRARWEERLGPRPGGLRIGLSWRGGGPNTGTTRRSLSLEQLARVLDLPGCEFVSLQYGEPRAEVEAFNAGRANAVRLFPAAEMDDFADLAGLVQCMDLVVSVQTAMVHLSGALGTECLALVPYNPEWRYMARGDAIPWYRSVRIFRQMAAGDWEPVIQEVAQALRERLAAGRPT